MGEKWMPRACKHEQLKSVWMSGYRKLFLIRHSWSVKGCTRTYEHQCNEKCGGEIMVLDTLRMQVWWTDDEKKGCWLAFKASRGNMAQQTRLSYTTPGNAFAALVAIKGSSVLAAASRKATPNLVPLTACLQKEKMASNMREKTKLENTVKNSCVTVQ